VCDRICGLKTMVHVVRGSELLETMPLVEIEKAGVKVIS
jgi:hypothetical protein